MTEPIRIRGLKQNNLKNVSLDIPKNKIVVFRSYGDGISYVRTGLQYAKSKEADVFINAWNSDLDKNYALLEELPEAEIHESPVQISEPLRMQWISFSNLIASKI